jgi:penicillin-binding protein 2
MAEEKMRSMIERSKSSPRFISFPIKKNLSLEEVSLIKSRIVEPKGAVLEIRPLRRFPYKDSLCHTLGTMGEISIEELAKNAKLGYRTGDLIGKSGIEKEYESYLRGEEGWEQLEIDAKGKQLASVNRKDPKPGSDVVLTIDIELQKYIEEIFFHGAGSVVAIDPDTGNILAMVSKPGFDLNLFSPSISERNWKELNGDPLHPLENRSVRGLYSPASTFKVITALAALNDKMISPERRFSCPGELRLAGQAFRCWNPYGHGSISMRRAITESCDVYFYELGLKIGPDRMAKYAAMFGLGTPTGLGLTQELPGLVPTPSWKSRTYSDTWKDGETITLAIGQGYLVSTPVQLAAMTAALANRGRLLRPSLIRQIVTRDGSVVFEQSPIVRWDMRLDHAAMAEIESAMKDVVMDKKGTGRRCRIPDINIYAKTGTSQVIRMKQRTKEEDLIPYHERTHAIFIAYVNDRPQKIALAVIVEHGGGGGASAAPIARKIIAKYYGVPDPGDPEEK